MAAAVLFDLGNTLAAYYHTSDFPPILAEAIGSVRRELARRGLCRVSEEVAMAAAISENREAPDYRVTPMTDRFERIFQVSLADDPSLAAITCERFLAPIFAIGRMYEDTLPTMAMLREAGVQTAIVSNAPWGSPPELWRRELRRLGLADATDAVVLCGDVGWRKPAPDIFHHALSALGRQPAECIFVGDDLGWDIEGSAAVGMRPLLIDRDGRHPEYKGARIERLGEILAVL
ncbi:MAG TPA: HAD family hydrolase [Vicinamibacterales bacterium]|nr:HAD family hydrolase [Vicinamibacterales bacterium]